MDTSFLRERLAREVSGDVFAPGEPGGAAASAAFNAAVVHRPAAVVAARHAADVAAAVRIAGEEGRRVAVQATGHGAPGAGEDT
ncbi:FAD-binding protein, partial [Nocardioides albidus]